MPVVIDGTTGITTPGLTNSGTDTLSSGTANGVAYLNGSKALTTGSALTFDGSVFKVAKAGGVVGPSNLVYIDVTSSYGGITLNSASGQNNFVELYQAGTTKRAEFGIDSPNSLVNLGGFNGYGLALYANGSKQATLDSSGNLGLGVTPNAWGSGRLALQVGGSTTSYLCGTNPNTVFGSNNYHDGTNTRYINNGNAANYIQTSGEHRWLTATSGTAGNIASFTQVMTVDANGSLLVGTTAPTYSSSTRGLIEVNGSNDALIALKRNNTSNFYLQNDSSAVYIQNTANTPLVFSTNNSERGRFTSAGEFWVAGTTDQGAYNIQCNGTGVWGAGAYVNGSDARIKEEIAPIDSGLDVVQKLNPVTYKYKEDWTKDRSTQTGFIAQELQVALEGKNYVDGIVQQGGSEGYYSVAYQNIIPILTKAIQELKAELDQAKAEIATLKGA